MFITTTILYFGESPIGYELYKVEDRFEFRPASTPTSNGVSPNIIVRSVEGEWQVEGVEDEDLRQQVIRLVQLQDVLNLQGKLSAAS